MADVPVLGTKGAATLGKGAAISAAKAAAARVASTVAATVAEEQASRVRMAATANAWAAEQMEVETLGMVMPEALADAEEGGVVVCAAAALEVRTVHLCYRRLITRTPSDCPPSSRSMRHLLRRRLRQRHRE